MTNWIAALTMLQVTAASPGGTPLPAGTALPSPPSAHHYIVDEASLLDSAAQRVVDSLTVARAASGRPIYVLTIRSLATHDSTDMPFEEFTRRVFEAWRAKRPGASHAAMLIVSVDDHRGRIEAGPAWGHDHDADLARILEDAIDPSIARGSLDQGIPQAIFEMTWVLKDAPVDPWLRDALTAAGVILLGALTLGFLRRRNARRAAEPTPEPAPVPRPAAALDPTLRVSQRMQAISQLRERSEKAASSITWLDTGEVPKFEGGEKPESAEAPGEPGDATDSANEDDESERG